MFVRLTSECACVSDISCTRDYACDPLVGTRRSRACSSAAHLFVHSNAYSQHVCALQFRHTVNLPTIRSAACSTTPSNGLAIAYQMCDDVLNRATLDRLSALCLLPDNCRTAEQQRWLVVNLMCKRVVMNDNSLLARIFSMKTISRV